MNKFTILTTIIAITIGLVTLIYTYRAYKTSKQSTSLTIQDDKPIISVGKIISIKDKSEEDLEGEFTIGNLDNYDSCLSFELHNEGKTTIKSISINKLLIASGNETQLIDGYSEFIYQSLSTYTKNIIIKPEFKIPINIIYTAIHYVEDYEQFVIYLDLSVIGSNALHSNQRLLIQCFDIGEYNYEITSILADFVLPF